MDVQNKSTGSQNMIRAALLLGCLFLVACSGTPVQTHYYLLRSDLEQRTRDLKPTEEAAMGRIIIAPYIDQPGLVLETGSGEIRSAMYHRWAEPMREGLQQFLRVEVSGALGQDVFPEDFSNGKLVFDVRVDQLHGTANGDALLVAYWWIRRGENIVSSYQFSETRPLVEDGYHALAAAEKALLSELASRIAGTLKEASPAAL